jgi:hypothetical protein
MKTKAINEEDRELPPDKLCDKGLQTTTKGLDSFGPTLRQMGMRQNHRHVSLGEHSFTGWHCGSAPLLWSRGIKESQDLGGQHPGVFFESYPLTLLPERQATESSRRIKVDDKSNDQYHDSESEDVYDLYNACNGVLHNGLLDIRKLDELSEEELEVLDVARLREIWAHTTTGCSQCERIIRTLNSARKLTRDGQIGSR